jgi:hypothetical protein
MLSYFATLTRTTQPYTCCKHFLNWYSLSCGNGSVKSVYQLCVSILEPSLSGFHIIEIDGNEWILDSGAYWASDGTVEVGIERNKLVAGLVGGEVYFKQKLKVRVKSSC